MDGSQLKIALVAPSESPEPFRKANVAIHIASLVGALTLQQQKMFDAFIKNAARQMSQTDRIWFEYPMKKLIDDVGLNSNNRDYVKAVINSLISTVVSWDHMNQKREWNSSGLLAGVRISGGICQYTFADNMRQLLTKPEVYTSIDMRISKRFKRGHAYALWQNIVRYANVGVTARHPVSKWRELVLGMDSHSGSYAQYKVFKSRVLLPSIKEINEVAEHRVDLVEIKSGRTVSELQFIVKRKDAQTELCVEQSVDAGALAEVVALGIKQPEARRLISKFGRDKVRLAIQYTGARMARKHSPALENGAGYFKKALAGGWGEPDQLPLDEPELTADSSIRQAEIQARFEAYRVAEARRTFNMLEVAAQDDLISSYNELQPVTILKFRYPGVHSKAAESAFYGWCAIQLWGAPSDSDLLSFLIETLSS